MTSLMSFVGPWGHVMSVGLHRLGGSSVQTDVLYQIDEQKDQTTQGHHCCRLFCPLISLLPLLIPQRYQRAPPPVDVAVPKISPVRWKTGKTGVHHQTIERDLSENKSSFARSITMF
ncbi:hypothetical protein NPIL_652071 [Nephila pilipes]|uniref:Uncharacterized protein n=1 Tax=Nephila pilipes TaxID=299642 RepID=A0A8X6R316_NEPPI|nr:hypothetical protein NPIL_652071 [Nephila pilipes]